MSPWIRKFHSESRVFGPISLCLLYFFEKNRQGLLLLIGTKIPMTQKSCSEQINNLCSGKYLKLYHQLYTLYHFKLQKWFHLTTYSSNYRVSHIAMYFMNWLWQIERYQLVWRWFKHPDITEFEFHQPIFKKVTYFASTASNRNWPEIGQKLDFRTFCVGGCWGQNILFL